MRESMMLIEQANIFKKINYKNLFHDQTSSKKDQLKTLSFHVYSSQYLISNTKQTKHHCFDKIILPSIDKDNNRYRQKTKRPSYHTSRYHSNRSNSSRTDLSLLTARGIKPELLTTIKGNDTMMSLQHHHAPPPSPSNDQYEQLLYQLNRTKQFTPTNTDGCIPYRLPALNQSTRRIHTNLSFIPKEIKPTLSNYFQTYY